MATLQKIRNRGKILIATVGLALFAFIAEEFVRSLSYTQTESRQRVGKICGEKINVQEFNTLVEEYTDVIKLTQGVGTLSDDQLSMIRDQVWQSLVIEKTIRQQTLNQKYQTLLNGLMVANPVAAKASFDGKNNESDIFMAALPGVPPL